MRKCRSFFCLKLFCAVYLHTVIIYTKQWYTEFYNYFQKIFYFFFTNIFDYFCIPIKQKHNITPDDPGNTFQIFSIYYKYIKKNKMHKIEWIKQPKKEGSNVIKIVGKINGLLFFEITQFKNNIFEDAYILTSKIIPMNMKQDKNLINLKAEAWGQYRIFLEKIS